MDMMHCEAHKADTIEVIAKQPHEAAYVTRIKNTLEAFQAFVGGYIQAVPLSQDVVMICNEEGKLKDMQQNFRWLYDEVVGPVLFVGADDEGDFTDCPMNKKELERELMLLGVKL